MFLALVVLTVNLFWTGPGAADSKAAAAAAAGIKAEKIDGSGVMTNKISSVQVPFIANEGQIENKSVLFYASTFGGTVYVTKNGELVYSLPKFEEKAKDKAKNKAADRLLKHEARDRSSNLKLVGGWSLKEQLVGASSVSPQGVDAVQTRVNYFVGSDKSKWHSSIPTYNMVSLGEVYPGIDLNLRARGTNTEKIFTVHPGGDVEQIKLKVKGAHSLAINARGELKIGTGLGPVRFTKPVAYQERMEKKNTSRWPMIWAKTITASRWGITTRPAPW